MCVKLSPRVVSEFTVLELKQTVEQTVNLLLQRLQPPIQRCQLVPLCILRHLIDLAFFISSAPISVSTSISPPQ